MKTLKILITDDHKMVRDGIRSMLESQSKKYNFKIQEAETGEDGVAQAKKTHFDIIIMDYLLPEITGAEAVQKILKNDPEANVLALSNYNEYMYIDRMIKAGVKGFVLKNISPEEMINAMETILSGKNYYSNDVSLKLLSFDVSKQDKKSRRVNLKALLSKREIQILDLISAELTTEEIAKKLHLSKRTVDAHRRNLLAKLEVKNTAGLMKYTLTASEVSN
jgi:DNA-binding NarL/FixJ family response regulator